MFSICVAPAHSVIACIGSMAGDVFIAVVCDGAASVNRALIIILLSIIYLMPAGEYIGFILATLLYRAR